MPGRWNDERERWRSESDWRDRDEDRRRRGRDEDRQRWSGGEDRSFRGEDRVFGERDTGAEYNRQRGSSDWQDRRYGGVSPGMRRGDYEMERGASHDYSTGGRYYGDAGRERIYREEYGLGGYDYGSAPRGYDEGRGFGSRGSDERYGRGMGRTFSGGTGGYDYERGYGDAGRAEGSYGTRSGGGRERDRDDRWRERFEDRAQDTGDFFRRTGQRISSWFSGGDRDEREDQERYEAYRGHRGVGPKGYKRSDDRISDEVHQRLTDDPWLDASEVTVAVSGGEVTLSGSVDSREAKHRAERIVEDLSGVQHVQNNLRVSQGNLFTSAGRGYGDAQQAQMTASEPVKGVTDGEAGKTTTSGRHS